MRICFDQSGNPTSHRVARHGAPPRVPETTGGQSRFLTAEADSEWQIDEADSSPLKRIRNDKLVEHSSWPFIDIGFFAVSTSANSVGGRGRPPHAARRRCERALR